MFSLADACQITAGPHNPYNICDTVSNKQANKSVEKNGQEGRGCAQHYGRKMRQNEIYDNGIPGKLGIYNGEGDLQAFLLFRCSVSISYCLSLNVIHS